MDLFVELDARDQQNNYADGCNGFESLSNPGQLGCSVGTACSAPLNDFFGYTATAFSTLAAAENPNRLPGIRYHVDVGIPNPDRPTRAGARGVEATPACPKTPPLRRMRTWRRSAAACSSRASTVGPVARRGTTAMSPIRLPPTLTSSAT